MMAEQSKTNTTDKPVDDMKGVRVVYNKDKDPSSPGNGKSGVTSPKDKLVEVKEGYTSLSHLELSQAQVSSILLKTLSLDETNTLEVIFAASLVVLISAARVCYYEDDCPYDGRLIIFAEVVGGLSMFIILVHFYMVKYKPTVAAVYSRFICISMLIWWGFGACIMTFNTPFSTAGNGYFASWLAFVMSAYSVLQSVDYVSIHTGIVQTVSKDKLLVFAVFMLSGIELVATLVLCNYDETWINDYGFALASGAYSACVCVLYLCVYRPFLTKVIAVSLGLLWMVAAGILTLDEIDLFGKVSNGYFAVWGCVAASLCLCHDVFGSGKEEQIQSES